ncbi:hypothetical protein XF35_11765 [Streptomyces platensis subsp. clarensis]|nr:hypothetical protein [Streptomyces platensis subsp. clarensis]
MNDIRAADYITVRVSALASQQNHHESTATLSNAAAALAPAEVAAVVVSLRSREVDEEAETLLKGYARDQSANDIMSLACGLLKYRLFADAEALLRAAVK